MATTGDSIVVIEDDHHISDLVAMYLRGDGFRVVQADDGRTGLNQVDREQPKLVVVDIGLPGELSGFDVCRLLRKDNDTPVVILTARDDEVDRILGLELGADDYITKPFSPRELVARVKAVLRRATAPPPPGDVSRIGPMTVARGAREVHVEGRKVVLTQREFDLLDYLVRRVGQVVTRDELLESVWGFVSPGETRTVEVHVAQLRKKLGHPDLIETVRGLGYKAAQPA
jgi:DNA-binding response OmpR family regulator